MTDMAAARTAPISSTLPPTSAAVPRRFENLDGLRGIAAVMVVVYHGILVFPQFGNPVLTGSSAGSWGWFEYSPLRVVLSGTEAVMVFFVLSGFVLTLPVLRAARFAWRAYYPSRILRLYVPVLAALIWSIVVMITIPRHSLSHDASAYMAVHAEPITFLKIARDAVLVDGANSYNGPFWSLQWEVIFSLLLPLYVFLAVRLKRVWLQMIFVLAAISAVATVLDRPSLEYLPAFGVGALIAAALPNALALADRINSGSRPRLAWIALAVLAALLITTAWTLAPVLPAPLLGATQFTVLLGATLFVFIALGSPGAKRFLTTRIVKWLGLISFSLYLTHEPIVIGVAQLLPRHLEAFGVILSVPVSLLVGWLFFRIVEKPAHRLSQAVKRRLTPPGQSTPTTPAVAG
jgi:peptidoglycan/LPS O-acetylase OafA/YrhL